MRLLLVGAAIANHFALREALRHDAAPFDRAADAEEARDYLRSYEYDVVATGLDLGTIRRLRTEGCRRRLVAVQVAEPDAWIPEAYHAGADMVLARGCSRQAAWAQLVAVVRRANGHDAPVLSAGELSLDMQGGQVTVAGAPVAVTAKERAILEMLLLRRGCAIAKPSILARLYNGLDEPEAKIVDVMVCKLRKKLKQAGVDGLIRTSWGQGYMVAA